MNRNFFDTYPQFYETTRTRRLPNRLQQRWRKIIEQNRDLLNGTRVLDLASHDGRWSFAALKAGAAYVEGVEGRADMVDSANETFAQYGIRRDAYSFRTGDVVEYLHENKDETFDIVLNLGFFYHTLKHIQILEGMAHLGRPKFIIDTALSLSPDPIIALHLDIVSDPRHAIDDLGTDREKVPVGSVSRSGLKMMLESLDYDCVEIDWLANTEDFTDCRDYEQRTRGTFVATPRS